MSGAPPPRRLSWRWWVQDSDGHVAVAQLPNPALAVWLVSLLLGATHLLGAGRDAALAGIGHGALVVWGVDEIVRGASPVRRLLGAVVLAGQLVALLG